MERFYTLVFIGGVGCFAIAFLLSMIFPWMSLESFHGMDYHTIEQLAEKPSVEFVQLEQRFPRRSRSTTAKSRPRATPRRSSVAAMCTSVRRAGTATASTCAS